MSAAGSVTELCLRSLLYDYYSFKAINTMQSELDSCQTFIALCSIYKILSTILRTANNCKNVTKDGTGWRESETDGSVAE